MCNMDGAQPLVRDAGGGAFVDERTALETGQIIGTDEWMRLILDDRLRHRVPTRRDRLVATRTPATVDVEIAHRSEAHDGTGIGGNIHRSGPLPHDLEAAEGREQLQH